MKSNRSNPGNLRGMLRLFYAHTEEAMTCKTIEVNRHSIRRRILAACAGFSLLVIFYSYRIEVSAKLMKGDSKVYVGWSPEWMWLYRTIAVRVLWIAAAGILLLLISYYILGMEWKVSTDSMTGLYQKAAFSEIVSQKLHGLKSQESEVAFVMLDVDYFKQINDTYGHVAGDEVIVQIAAALRDMFDEEGVICRMGGDEFAVFSDVPGIRERLPELLEQVAQRAESLWILNREQIPVGISYGIYIGNGAMDFQYLYEHADGRLYQKKRGRKGRRDD